MGRADREAPEKTLLPALSAVLVAVLAIAIVTALALTRARHTAPQPGAASSARIAPPSPTESPIPMPNSAQVVAPSADSLWVLVASTRLYRSMDHGQTWERRSLPPDLGRPPSISFLDDHQGWVLAPGSPTSQCEAGGAVIWHTTDAGNTWTKLAATGLLTAQCKEHIVFVDSTHGFITAWDDNHRPTVYRTRDGGLSWVARPLPDPPDFVTSPGGFVLRAVWIKPFGSNLYLLAWGAQDSPIHDRQYIFKSTDGGATWSWLTKVPSSYMVMVTESRWLHLVIPDQSEESTNGGQQWHPYVTDFSTDTPVGGPQIVFADSKVGYAEGRGSLQRTLDGGAHWERIKTPGTLSA